ncbi:XrtA/PEP-CTERM system TPR-repeat protein PrsT [Roseomonas sp. AR75]|uniref:XrtA/PEP-CTERM system TPR-repeat protein PrsT n=1 Tax=Roseomonas sp. AR75 TaxID=2562311 RepID=UPI0014851984|nr:XrtA/PEP-CTERM system TPR-repeat protein PrsT [Roseomonas sp. AR75]
MATPPFNIRRSPLMLAATLAFGLGAGSAIAQPLERARAAQARGDLRAAQIDYRNAVRAQPDNAAVRMGLAQVSMDLGDPDTAEREARAALERGFDKAQATALLMRTYLARGRFRELLRDFPQVDEPAALAAQIAAARTFAELGLNQRDAARASAEAAVRFAPDSADAQLAAGTVALAAGDRAAAEAAVDRALAADPTSQEAQLRKASFQAERGQIPMALETLGKLITQAPGNVSARVLRAELLIRTGQEQQARPDIDAALRIFPSHPAATYLTALMQVRAQDWRAADETLQRMGAALPMLGDALLLQATVKRALNEPGQAEDAAQRYVARRPDDARGAKLLASLQLERNRPDAAAATLTRLAQRNAADAEAMDMLGRAHVAAGRPREAVIAYARAAEMAPNDSGIRARLAAARLASGDSRGTSQAATESLRLAPEQSGARELLAIAALARGDITGAQAEYDRLTPEQRKGEAAGTLEGLLALSRFEVQPARRAFEEVLRNHPESIGARLGLARVATAEGNPVLAERLLVEVLQRAPSHPEALGRLLATVMSGPPRAEPALIALQAAHAAAPNDPQLAITLATAFGAMGQPERGLAVVDTPELRRAGQGPQLPLTRSQAYAALERWPEAEQAARAALADDPTFFPARRQLLSLLLRNGDQRGAEAMLEEALRTQPANAALQQLLLVTVRENRGLDAALQLADRLAGVVTMRPASLSLRGDLLMAAQRPAEAAQAYAAASRIDASSTLTLREAGALRAAGKPQEALALLSTWLQKEPDDIGALNLAAQIDIAAGRNDAAERLLTRLVEKAPDNAVALNNLAWLLQERGRPEDLQRARAMSERAYFLMPGPETADTFGWILSRTGDRDRALVLLRQSASAPRARGQAPDPGKVFRYAATLNAAGQKEEAIKVLEPALAGDAAFPERAEAERLLAEMRRG